MLRMVLVLCIAHLLGSLSPLSANTNLAIRGHQFTINGEPKFLLGMSYYGALGARKETILHDLDEMQRRGFNWIRVWSTWSYHGQDVSAVDASGNSRDVYLEKLQWLVDECDRRGMIVDVTLTRIEDKTVGGGVASQEAHLRAVRTLIEVLKKNRNWYLDLANERNVRDTRYVSFEELGELSHLAHQLKFDLLVTASDGNDLGREDLSKYLLQAKLDFLTPHRGRDEGIHRGTESKSEQYFNWMVQLGRVVPLHYQEPFRRGYAPDHWEPVAADFSRDLRNAIAGGAAGWCFHNGDQKDHVGKYPHRSFDLREKGLFEQLDIEEMRFVGNAERIMDRRRVMIETDAGGDPDDEQSLVRFLLYANEWDVEGIICNRERARDGENRNAERTGLGIVQQQLKAYGECFGNLKQHDALYPEMDELWRKTVRGYADTDDGVNQILHEVDSWDGRPIWFMNWGTDHGSSVSNLKRALDKVLATRGEEGYRIFKSKLRISGDDRFAEHTTTVEPPFLVWVNTKEPELDGLRWYRQFGPLTAKAGDFDLQRDVLENHGPLGKLYPTNTNIPQKEGDTTEFLYLVPTGMNDPMKPQWGSWAGRYGRNNNYGEREVYWANQVDSWNGSTSRDNTLKRWAADFQNDFRARMDWCVSDFATANHPPDVLVNSIYGQRTVRVQATAGTVVSLHANGSWDADGDVLDYHWSYYPEAGSYTGEIRIQETSSAQCSVLVPGDATGKQIHIILAVRDDGEPVLTRYRRVVIDVAESRTAQTKVSTIKTQWFVNDRITYPGSNAEGLLMNTRMVNCVFDDRNPQTRPTEFDADRNTDQFIAMIPKYLECGIRAFTVGLQGGSCGYEGALNSAFESDGKLRNDYMMRVARVIEACDDQGAVVILSCFYQRQDQVLGSEDAIRIGVANIARWIDRRGYKNVVLEIANEFSHAGFDHRLLKDSEGERELIALAKQLCPGLLVSTSGVGDGRFPRETAEVADILLVHFNNTDVKDIPKRVEALRTFGKPIVCNEDDKLGESGAACARLCVEQDVSWGFMHVQGNQHYPFAYLGRQDDAEVYGELAVLTSPSVYFPPSESRGGWRKLEQPEEVERQGGMDVKKLAELREWLLQSDDRDFAAVVIHNGYVVLEVERGNSSKTDTRRVASVSKAVCATVLAIASEESRQGGLPHRMTFDDPAFQFIPWAQPLSDKRKAHITVRQLLNHTSGICPESIGARNDGDWKYVLGHSGDEKTMKLAFDPGQACGYSTHAFHHAALVCETVTGKPYDQYAIEALFKPIGCEHWWFQYYEGSDGIGSHPSHGLGMPARDLARIGYCMLQNGKWENRQVIPQWFVSETTQPTHDVSSPELRWKLNPRVFTHGWELPSNHWHDSQKTIEGIPVDARYKPGSGGQLLAFVPSLQLVVARQTGGSGDWKYEEFLQRTCQAVQISKP